jgi:predicted Zn-dependent protease
LLRKIYEEQQVNPTVVPPYFLSHPLTGERMSYLESALGKTEWEVKRYAPSWEFERVQAIARGNCQTRRQAVPPYERRLAEAKPGKDHAEALELIGVLMAYGGDYELGVKYLEQAQSAGRKVDRGLGRSYLRTGKVDKALPLLEPAVAANPRDWSATADLGEAYYQKGDYEKAVRALSKANELYPYRPEVMRTLGRALDKAGKRGAGFYYFAQAAEFEGDAYQALTYYSKASAAMSGDDVLRVDVERRLKALEDAKPPIPPGPPNGGRAQRPR